MIDDAERRLKEVIYKQSQLKHNLQQAQQSLRQLLAGFVDQLASLSASTGNYHDKIASSAQRSFLSSSSAMMAPSTVWWGSAICSFT